MKRKYSFTFLLVALMFTLACNQAPETKTSDVIEKTIVDEKPVLPSWNDGQTKQNIIDFVSEATNAESPNFVPVADRIATFDNDGTLWSEQPAYFQLFFAIDRVKAMAADHPEWKEEQPYKAILENDMPTLMQQGMAGLMKIIMTTHAGMTTDEFDQTVLDWIETAKHPTKNRAFTDLVFQPMLELLDYLRDHKFKVFIVSGGGIEFMRPWTEKVYGIPKNQVVGSSVKTQYDWNDGKPVIEKIAEIDLIDDKEGKPVAINKYIGRKPVFAVGNSDGDLQMLRWADANSLASFKLYVHHTDSVREWAYDRNSHIGAFDKGLDEANEKGWTVIDMAKDWKLIYPFELEK